MKFMNMLIKYYPTLLSATPWGGMKNIFMGGIAGFMADLVVPILAAVAIIFGFVQIPGCVTEYRHGQGNEFWKKIMFTAGCFIVGIGLTAVWGLFASYLN